MGRRTRTVLGRAAAAYDTLRGRPAKPDHGILIIFPFLAAAGGSLAALAVEMVIEGRRSRRLRAGIGSPGAARPDADLHSTVDSRNPGR